MKISQMVKELRVRLFLTQQQFAERYNTTANTVARWERGASTPRLPIRVNIERTFKKISNQACHKAHEFVMEDCSVEDLRELAYLCLAEARRREMGT